jgi:hypothetical protein
MHHHTQTQPTVKTAAAPGSPRRVRILSIDHVDILIPEDIHDTYILEIVAILDRSLRIESHWSHNTYETTGAPTVSYRSEVRKICPDIHALVAHRELVAEVLGKPADAAATKTEHQEAAR